MKIIYTCTRTYLAVFYFLLLFLTVLGTASISVVSNISENAINEEERYEFLKSLGIELHTSPEEVKNITIPWKFDSVYKAYNDIQKKAGYDLYKFAGKELEQYTYRYEEYFVHIIIYEGKVVGGDICEPYLNGSMLPLLKESINELNAS